MFQLGRKFWDGEQWVDLGPEPVPDAMKEPTARRMYGRVRVVLNNPGLSTLKGTVGDGDAQGLYLIDAGTVAGADLGTVYVPWTSVAYVYPERGEHILSE